MFSLKKTTPILYTIFLNFSIVKYKLFKKAKNFFSLRAKISDRVTRSLQIDSAVTLSAVISFEKRRISGRTELRCGKRHILEYRAGIVFLCRDTFLIGNAVFCSVDKILGGTNYPYYREDTERYGEITSVCITKRAVYVRGYTVGNIVAATATAATATIVSLSDLTVKDNGIDYLYDSYRHVLRCTARFGDSAVIRRIGIALEYAYVTLSAVQDNSLFKNGDSFKFLTLSTAKACLKGDLNVKFDKNRIKSAVKLYGIYSYICPHDARVFGTDVGSMLDYIVAKIGEKHFYVLKTISVAAGIQDTVRFYANRFVFCYVFIRNTARKSAIVLHK